MHPPEGPAWLVALETSGFALAMRHWLWLYPIVEILHIEDDKGPVVLKSEFPMSPAFAALLEWLQTHLPDD